MNSPLDVGGTLVVAAAAAGALVYFARGAWRLMRLSVHAFEEIVGTEDKKGQPGTGKPGLAARLHGVEKQLEPNGGGSLRDKVDKIHAEALEASGEARKAVTHAEIAAEGVVRLEGYAKQNREGIADLRDQANDLSRRLTDVDEKADALGERQTDHRRRNDTTVTELKQFIEDKYGDMLLANEGLRATVTELLNMPDPISEERDQ